MRQVDKGFNKPYDLGAVRNQVAANNKKLNRLIAFFSILVMVCLIGIVAAQAILLIHSNHEIAKLNRLSKDNHMLIVNQARQNRQGVIELRKFARIANYLEHRAKIDKH